MIIEQEWENAPALVPDIQYLNIYCFDVDTIGPDKGTVTFQTLPGGFLNLSLFSSINTKGEMWVKISGAVHNCSTDLVPSLRDSTENVDLPHIHRYEGEHVCHPKQMGATDDRCG